METNRIAMLYDKAKDIEQWGRSMGFDTVVKMEVNVGGESIQANLNAVLSETAKRNERGY
jgi:hypothetical protein